MISGFATQLLEEGDYNPSRVARIGIDKFISQLKCNPFCRAYLVCIVCYCVAIACPSVRDPGRSTRWGEARGEALRDAMQAYEDVKTQGPFLKRIAAVDVDFDLVGFEYLNSTQHELLDVMREHSLPCISARHIAKHINVLLLPRVFMINPRVVHTGMVVSTAWESSVFVKERKKVRRFTPVILAFSDINGTKQQTSLVGKEAHCIMHLLNC